MLPNRITGSNRSSKNQTHFKPGIKPGNSPFSLNLKTKQQVQTLCKFIGLDSRVMKQDRFYGFHDNSNYVLVKLIFPETLNPGPKPYLKPKS